MSSSKYFLLCKKVPFVLIGTSVWWKRLYIDTKMALLHIYHYTFFILGKAFITTDMKCRHVLLIIYNCFVLLLDLMAIYASVTVVVRMGLDSLANFSSTIVYCLAYILNAFYSICMFYLSYKGQFNIDRNPVTDISKPWNSIASTKAEYFIAIASVLLVLSKVVYQSVVTFLLNQHYWKEGVVVCLYYIVISPFDGLLLSPFFLMPFHLSAACYIYGKRFKAFYKTMKRDLRQNKLDVNFLERSA